MQASNPIDQDVASVLDVAAGFWRSQVLFTGVKLGLFTLLAQEPSTREEIVRRLNLDLAVTGDLLDALVAIGLLHRADGRYRNSAVVAACLDESKPTYVGGFLKFMSRALYPQWSSLTDLARTGEVQKNSDAFRDLYADAARIREFMSAMDCASMPVVLELTKRFPWADHHTFVDLGGARGNLAGHLVKAHDHLTGVCLDLPVLEPVFREHMHALSTGDRVTFRGADFLVDPLPEADVLIFGHVLHDWNEKTRVALLRRAFDAVKSGGAVVIYDEMIDDDRSGPAHNLLMSLNMRIVRAGAAEYTAAECRSWLSEAGFTDFSIEDLTATERLVVARKR
ncbi:methyltransferase [Amycolatopsis decaplanina]|uniref:O-methyltransferase family 2 n=1 Tax=Amycolatopsis decaplanina DSM 44594 TaxID=1284240 RepID=M2Z9M1_9PSEU|nr:methyltransferase [Amycolatopsis decaplanina]EME57633.1 O-methyltransferase family 2 [Amycolatopsis decaplanina DSM 44594]